MGQHPGLITFFNWLSFLWENFSFKASAVLSFQNQPFPLMAEALRLSLSWETQLGQGTGSHTAPHRAVSPWHSSGPRQPAPSQIMPGCSSGASRQHRPWGRRQLGSSHMLHSGRATVWGGLRSWPGQAVSAWSFRCCFHNTQKKNTAWAGKATDGLNSHFMQHRVTTRNCGESGLRHCFISYNT